jgi:hypothetical protein
MAKIIVLAVRNWELRDEKTGEIRSGVKVEGCEGQINEEKDYRGAGFVEYKATPEAWESLKTAKLPAICDVEISLSKARAKNGSSVAVAAITSATVIAPIDFLKPARVAA